MNDVEWDEIAEDLEYGFKWPPSDPWSGDRERVYRRHLDEYPAAVVKAAIAKLSEQDLTWGPTYSRILSAMQHDPGIPTWPEARALLFGKTGALTGHVRGTPDTNPRYWTDRETAALTRLQALHPVLLAFVAAQGVQHLMERPVDGEDGKWTEIRLRDDYERHVKAWEDRGQHVRAAARLGHGQLRQLAPLAGIPHALPMIGQASAPQIGAA